MSIIRSDDEADSVEILKLIIETTDYYREMADTLADDELDSKLANIASERATYIQPFKDVVRQLNELPAQPDPDKELMQKIGGEITQFFSTDSKNAILDKCLREDSKLADLIKQTRLGEKSAEFQKLLDSLSGNLSNTKNSLQALKN